MCGTLTSILGQAVALMVVETMISPSLGAGELIRYVDYMIKGVATFWIYKYAQCSGTSGTTSRPLSGYKATTIIVGGLIGAVVLTLTNIILPGKTLSGGLDFLGYVIQAVVLNLAYGMGSNIVADLA